MTETDNLDDFISRMVFRTVVMCEPSGERYCYVGGKRQPLTPWSSDRTSAIQLVDYLKRMGNVIAISNEIRDGEIVWRCSINGVMAEGPEMALTICRTVKAALEKTP